MAIRSGRVTGVASILAALLLIALPAGAAPAPQNAIEEIWAVVDEASQAMSGVVDDFEVAITSMTDPGDVETAQSAADHQVTEIANAAKTELDELARLYKGVGKEVKAAKQQLHQARNASRDEIVALANTWVPPVPSTTTSTTTPTTTTTTIAPTTTTTTHGNSGTTPKPPGSGGGNGNGNSGAGGGGNGSSNAGAGGNGNSSQGQGGTNRGGTATANESDISSGSSAVAVTPELAVEQTIDAGDLGFLPEVSAIAVAGDVPRAPAEQGSEEAVITTQVSTVLETVLPPAVVNAVLSPLLVVEILTKTIMADGQKVLLPVALLALCALLIALGDRIESRSSRLIAYFRK
jgi:hypothetical protein